MGANLVLNSRNDKVLKVIKELAGHKGGADVVFEAVGISETFHQAFNIVKNDGKLINIGNIIPHVELDLREIVNREINISGSCASTGEYLDCIPLFTSGKIDPAPILSKVLPLSEGPKAFKELSEGKTGSLKIILKP